MSKNTETMKNINASKIIGIQFSILSPEEIRKGSVAEITSRDTYINNKPVINGLFDPRMGVLEPGIICPTDGLDYMQTPGYFGHIELSRPVFYIQYLGTILKLLRCVCFKCSKLLISKEKYKQALKMSAEARWNYIFSIASKIRRCGEDIHDGCGCLQPNKIKKEGLASIFAEWKSNQSEGDTEPIIIPLTPELVLKIFKRISDEDVSFMGFSPVWSRPDWMICQVLAVPPPAVRPSVKHDAQQRSEDDLSHILVNIIKTNKTLQEKIQNNSPANVINDWTTVLQYYIGCQIDNKIPGANPVAQRSGRPLKSIKDRLNGKGGRMRGNLMAKRVDFSARSVITADPNISIRELGIPLKIAKNITKPVTVNRVNKSFLTKLVQNGPDIYPGAKLLERKTGVSITLRYVDRNSIILEDGDIVHRHMMDGDPILFNRQPTLHRMSMMCHIARIMKKGDTFRMNVADTKPYNADFDGDEMNLHMPQDVESESELRNLAAVPYQIISPANNASIIGIYQDSMLGAYRFTRKDIKFTNRDAMNLLMMFDKVNTDSIREGKLSSFDLLTQILPPLSLKVKNKQFDGDKEKSNDSNNIVEIKDGNYLRGQIDKGILGSGTKGIIHRICNDFGNMASANFIDDFQNIITAYMNTSSFSVGISDLISDNKTNDEIIKVINNKKTDVKNLIDQIQIGVFENNSGKTNEQEFETKVNNILNQAAAEAGKIGLKSLSEDNRFVIMVNAGSKGSELNISQMISCLGQQNVDGKRIPYGFEHRTLPHYNKYDDSPAARGFVESSYINGLSPQELFFHAMGGRVGLIDTAVKSVTWETPIVIIENEKAKYVEIGRWIDEKLAESPENIKHYTDRQMELLDIHRGKIFIPTTDEDGNITWGDITAVTRHDPGTELYEIKTSGGRNVIVTESKSLLIWNPETKKFKEMLTPDIKVGDCVPVTAELCEPPILLESIDMQDYLSKKEYVYGSEFNYATKCMKEEMENKNKIPSGWWDKNNGTVFTLPYTKKSSLQRTIVRSNLTNIQNGFIYPFHAQRKDTLFPDKFLLNEENGIFIGLFLAEGHASYNSVSITNNNENIRNFVKKWFNKFNICFTETEKINIGKTITIKGNSSLLVNFLTKLVGHKAENKHVPSEAFISNDQFIIGLLNGYFSGDGTISKNSVEVGSASKRLIEGISMLCSRLNIFGKVFKTQLKSNNLGTKNIKPTYRFAIRAQWGQIFAKKINLLENNKQTKLQTIIWGKSHRNFDTYNNTVLDKIIEINIIGVEKHPKVYDLTIPSTLNFGLANGLQVRDTSTTGYIQRRLIKGMEDLMVNYDMTIRTNKNKIVQFSYGEDSFDTIKVENQELPLVDMSIQDIYAHYNIPEENTKGKTLSAMFLKATLAKYKRQINETNTKCKFYTDYIIASRDKIVPNIFGNKEEKIVRVPVAFAYIIANIIGQQSINPNSLVDITPLEAFDLIEDAFNSLEKIYFASPNELFKVLYFYYLSPKDLLFNKRFNRKALEILLETIVLNYKRAIVAPGEMVGMIAAQSIGEPTTQLTLNTFHFAGIASKSNVTRGVPRIEEILSLSAELKNPSLTVYLKPEDETDKDKAHSIMYMLEHTKLQEVVKNIEICFDPDDLNTLIDEDKDTMSQYREFENLMDKCLDQELNNENEKSKWIIRIEINPEVMLEKNITMDDINFTLNNAYQDEITCVYSDYNADKLVFRIRMNNIMNASKNQKKGKINPLDQSDEIYLLKNFQDQLLQNIVLRGIKKINKVILRKIKDNMVEKNGSYKKQEIWVLDTVGTNLLDVLGLDYIDFKRTISNDIIEIFNVLGVEAARRTIYNELVEVLEFDGSYLNYHHTSLLCDRMAYNIKLVSIFRHGINNDNIGPIAKASFEETPEMFLKAARHAELDNMRGVSANVMCGQEGFVGTSCFQVVLDIKEMSNLEEKIKYESIDPNEIINKEMFGEEENPEDPCSINKLKIENDVVNIKTEELGNENDYNPFE